MSPLLLETRDRGRVGLQLAFRVWGQCGGRERVPLLLKTQDTGQVWAGQALQLAFRAREGIVCMNEPSIARNTSRRVGGPPTRVSCVEVMWGMRTSPLLLKTQDTGWVWAGQALRLAFQAREGVVHVNEPSVARNTRQRGWQSLHLAL